ncbi:MAG: VCBS repeat-containing protein [Peptococcaceae bacterium]|nr:VCBS repeat-containing protein [Peptococcaceae bacterium]
MKRYKWLTAVLILSMIVIGCLGFLAATNPAPDIEGNSPAFSPKKPRLAGGKPLDLTPETVWQAYASKTLWGFQLKTRHFDLDGDGTGEIYTLLDGRLRVAAGAKMIWHSPGGWWVDDFVLGDANNDGIPDLNLLVWKAGSFGPCKPFWIKQEDRSIKNHFFIFDLVDGSFKPVWQSSNLDRPNYAVILKDLDEDGENELIAVEGSYTDSKVKRITIWKWNGWGFSVAR